MRWRTAVAALLVLLPLAGACKKSGPKPGEDGTLGTGMDEQGLGGAGAAGSSLERARKGMTPEEDGILKDVHFGFDKADLDSEARAVADRNVEWLRANPRAKVELEGHTDSRGTIEYNLALGAKRAKAVKDYLGSQGIASDRLSTISYGEELPLCREETEECWARNRRVHSVILGQ